MLRYKDDVFTIEFDIGENEASYSWAERHGEQKHISSDHVQTLENKLSFYKDIFFARSELSRIKSEVNSYKKEIEVLTEKNKSMEQKISFYSEKYDMEIESIRNDSKTRQPFLVMWAGLMTAVLVGVVLKLIFKS